MRAPCDLALGVVLPIVCAVRETVIVARGPLAALLVPLDLGRVDEPVTLCPFGCARIVFVVADVLEVISGISQCLLDEG